jgi:Flp pilus assembly pilin Flp
VRQGLRLSIRYSWLRKRINAVQLKKLFEDEEGITALEYGLLAAAIAGVLIVVAYFFGNRLGNQINRVAVHI